MSKELTPKERKAEYDREYRKRNKERIAEYKRAWLRKNSLRVSDKRHEYYMKHKKERQMKKISEEIREFDEWLERKYANREDKDSLLPVGITDAEFSYWAIQILLGGSWHVESPAWKTHMNEKALEEIIFKKCGVEAKDRKGKGEKSESRNRRGLGDRQGKAKQKGRKHPQAFCSRQSIGGEGRP